MRCFLVAPVLCSLASLAPALRAQAQAAPEPDKALQATLLKRADEMMAAWKKHDSAAVASMFSPGFVYVGSEGVITSANDTIKGLMTCTLSSYRITESSLRQISPDAAVLITTQQQQVTCAGHPIPAVMNMTDTYIRRGGKWLILVHTEAAPPTP